MKTKHTPGPWTADAHYVHANGLRFLAVSGCPSGGEAEGEANAQLIALSPDMLAALQAIDAAYDSSAKHGHPIAQPLYAAVMSARAVLARGGYTQPLARSEIA